jgi:hypothetical protein
MMCSPSVFAYLMRQRQPARVCLARPQTIRSLRESSVLAV